MPPAPPLPWRPWTLALTLVVGLGGSAAAGWLGHHAETSRRRQQLDGEMALRVQRLKAGLESHAFILDAMSAHFLLHPPRNDAEYEAYLRQARPLELYPGLRGVTLGLVLSPGEVPEKEREAREDRSLLPGGHPGFHLNPPLRPDRVGAVFMVRFVHPMATNAGALGFDSASRPDQAEALARAARTDTLTATGPVPSAQDPQGPPTLILRKLLRDPRSGVLWGYLNSLWQPQVSLPGLQTPNSPMELQLVDLGRVGVLEEPRAFFGPDLSTAAHDRRIARLDFGGRILELRMRPKAGAPGFGPIWWPSALGLTLAALTLLAAYRHWTVRSLAAQIQADLTRTELRLKTVLDQYPDLLILLDDQLNYLDIFTGQESLLALPKAELYGKRPRDVLPPPMGEAVDRISRQVLEMGQTAHMQYELDLPDGHHHFEANIARIDDAHAKERRILWSIRDITLRKEAEQRLRQREEEFRRFFEASPSPLLISRLSDGRVLIANEALRRLMQVPPDADLVGTTPSYYADPSQRAALLRHIQERGRLAHADLDVRTARGELRHLSISSELIHLGGEEVLLTAMHDLTEQRRSEEALRQAQKLESLGLMAGGIAHDFNNLLAAMQGNLDLARLSEDRRAQETHLDAAAAALQRAADLTRQLLAYSGKTPLRTGPVDLGQLASEMASLLRVSISRRIELELALPGDLPPIEGDRAQLQQVILNLVTNAADAIGSAPGRIEVRGGKVQLDGLEPFPGQALSAGPHAWLSVRDSGCGMTSEVKERIFDPFFTTKSQGRGLGLSAMQGILRAHHAGLQIESEPGEGSTFTLYFPALPARAEAAAQESAPAPSMAFRGRVLVVDDEETLRQATAALLEHFGFEVQTAAGGHEGLKLLAEHPPDLVILDLTMPVMDGTEVLRRLRETHPDLPVILCSGYASSEVPAMNGDANLSFLQKPFTLAALKAELARRLQR